MSADGSELRLGHSEIAMHWHPGRDLACYAVNCEGGVTMNTQPTAPNRDGGCLVCDECDGDEGHTGTHDCHHAESEHVSEIRRRVNRDIAEFYGQRNRDSHRSYGFSG